MVGRKNKKNKLGLVVTADDFKVQTGFEIRIPSPYSTSHNFAISMTRLTLST